MSHQDASLVDRELFGQHALGQPSHNGRLIVNADDWGRDRQTTERTLECAKCGAISSVSAMVFMDDSERAAAIALERGIDAGLHLNFTTVFSASRIPARLSDNQRRLSRYLRRSRWAQVVFHPGLVQCFEYVVAAQREEFQRLYGRAPDRLDGHHHMHLSANVLFGGLLPTGTIVRRNFSFQPGEKGFTNRFYRQMMDRVLARHHRLRDFFFSLHPLEPTGRLQRIFDLSRQFAVEVETHPYEPAEYSFLTGGGIRKLRGPWSVAPRFDIGLREEA
jgi:hypothetical protein